MKLYFPNTKQLNLYSFNNVCILSRNSETESEDDNVPLSSLKENNNKQRPVRAHVRRQTEESLERNKKRKPVSQGKGGKSSKKPRPENSTVENQQSNEGDKSTEQTQQTSDNTKGSQKKQPQQPVVDPFAKVGPLDERNLSM